LAAAAPAFMAAAIFFEISNMESRISARSTAGIAAVQGLTLVHLSAQRKRFLCDEGYLGGVWGVF
jgi:hypothetical protein